MKSIGAATALVGLTSAFFLLLHAQQPAAAPLPQIQSPAVSDCAQCVLLAAQIDELRRGLADIKTQLASPRDQLVTEGDRLNDHPMESEPDSQLSDLEAGRVADAERRKEYMAGVAQAFGNERINDLWAGRASLRISAALEADDVLRDIAHKVECRWQTCRVELDDDGAGKISTRMPFIVMGLADVLPGMNAEQVTRGDGRSATVLYMSNAQPAR